MATPVVGFAFDAFARYQHNEDVLGAGLGSTSAHAGTLFGGRPEIGERFEAERTGF